MSRSKLDPDKIFILKNIYFEDSTMQQVQVVGAPDSAVSIACQISSIEEELVQTNLRTDIYFQIMNDVHTHKVYAGESTSKSKEITESDSERALQNELKFLLAMDELEPGDDSDAVDFLRTQMKNNPNLANKLVGRVYQDCVDNICLMRSLISVMFHFGYNDFEPYGICLLMAALHIKDALLNEYTVSLLDRWDDPRCLKALRTYEPISIWMKRMVDKVIRRLESK